MKSGVRGAGHVSAGTPFSETSRPDDSNARPRGVHQLYALNVSAAPEHSDILSIPTCEVCGGTLARPRFLIEETKYSIVVCTGCGLGMLSPPPTPAEIESFYPDDYYGNEGAKFSRLIEPLVRIVGARRAWFVAKQVRAGGRVLDVGCGRGITLRGLADAGCETHGFEVSAQAVQGIDSRVSVRVASSLADASYPNEYFDAIVIWHVLEHVPHPRHIIEESMRILRPGGVLIVAVPNFSSVQAWWAGAAWFHLDPPRHIYHFPLAALRKLLQTSGLNCRSSHHFSLRQNPYGWIQSALNKASWLPQNGLYAMLHCRDSGQRLPFSFLIRLQLWVGFWLLAFPAIIASVVAALLRSGATVHVVAEKPLDS